VWLFRGGDPDRTDRKAPHPVRLVGQTAAEAPATVGARPIKAPARGEAAIPLFPNSPTFGLAMWPETGDNQVYDGRRSVAGRQASTDPLPARESV